jgi:Leucine-rich repeat (LRR) protein
MKEFKVNEYITLKLERGSTSLYVKNKLFRYCKYLLLSVPLSDVEKYEEIDSIDEASEILDHSIERDPSKRRLIDPETEFWGHCSNIQSWYEYNYDTRILHSNIAFPLLKRLTEVGDPIARRVFKDEIAKRVSSNHFPVFRFLLENNYFKALTPEEFKTIFLTISPAMGCRMIDYFISTYRSNDLDGKGGISPTIQYINHIYQLEPLNNDVLARLADFFYIKEEYNKAFELYNKVISKDSNHRKSLIGLGNIFSGRHEPNKAIKCYEKALDLQFSLDFFTVLLCGLYIKQGRMEDALQLVEKVFKHNVNNINIWDFFLYDEIVDDLRFITKASIFLDTHLRDSISEVEKLLGLTKKSVQAILKNKIRELSLGIIVNNKIIAPNKGYLDLSNRRIRSLSNIENLDLFPDITGIDLSENKLVNIQKIVQCENLDFLRLNHNLLKTIEGLENFTRLKRLEIGSNKITKISGLNTLKNLDTLILRWNAIEKIEGLEELTNLRTLQLHGNQIPSIEGLDSLEKLEELYLSSNSITEIQGLDQLRNLKTLYLGYNKITDIKGLYRLPKLEILDLRANSITSMKGLGRLYTLRQLDLPYNPISQIESIKNLKTLEKIDLSKTSITEVPEWMTTLPALKKLRLERCNMFQYPQSLGQDVLVTYSKEEAHKFREEYPRKKIIFKNKLTQFFRSWQQEQRS